MQFPGTAGVPCDLDLDVYMIWLDKIGAFEGYNTTQVWSHT